MADLRFGRALDNRRIHARSTPLRPTLFTDSTLGTPIAATHPLMQEVTALNGHFRHTVALAPGATQVAEWADGVPLIAVKTQAGHTGVGINNYVGDAPNQWSGQFGRVVVNAARWLKPAITVSGALTLGDPTQGSRLFRGGTGSECGAAKYLQHRSGLVPL